MTYELMMEVLRTLGNDIDILECTRNNMPTIRVDYQDFLGFDENWNEIEREYDNPMAVETFQHMLPIWANSYKDGYYETYFFNGFQVITGYASYEI